MMLPPVQERECAELLVAVLVPDDGTVFGRRTLPWEMAMCSLACAVVNLWLAAGAENLGLGWLSLFDPKAPGARPMAVLCLGRGTCLYDEPMLQAESWRQGWSAKEFVHTDYRLGDASDPGALRALQPLPGPGKDFWD